MYKEIMSQTGPDSLAGKENREYRKEHT